MDYSPLDVDRNDIRVITILPPNTHPDEPHMINCVLENVSLDDYTPEYNEFLKTADSDLRRDLLLRDWMENCRRASGISKGERIPTAAVGRYTWTDYIALSYTWGDPAITDIITVNGRPFQVTKNLHSALHHLRTNKNFTTGIRLWVDAICINQKDVQERNLQVQRMRHIYSQAINTFVWLGQEADDSNRAIDLLDIFAKGGNMVKVVTPTEEKPLSPSEAAMWIALYRFLDRPYWKRVWIVQEIIASYSTLSIICGDRQLSLEDMNTAISTTIAENYLAVKNSIRYAYQGASLPEPPVSIKTLMGRIMRLNLPFIDMIKSQHRMSLPMLLDISRTSEQTDPRDKLYAILGLLDRNVADLITPDYDLPTWKVFASLSKAVITATDRLDILRHCVFEPLEDRQTPSWVPNLMIEVHTNDLSETVAYQACCNTQAIFQFVGDDRGLVVTGFRIDTVDGLGCTFWDFERSETSIVQPTTGTNAYGVDKAVRNALWRALVAAGKEKNGTNTPEIWELLLHVPPSSPTWFNDELRRRFDSMHEFLDLNGRMKICGRELKDWFFSDVEHLQDSLTASEISASLFRMFLVHTHRRLMTTSQGYVGIAPSAAQQGDVICILLGSSVPMVLRPIEQFEKCYSLVGECYAQGLMDGEAMEWLATGRCQLEEFVIC